RLIPAEALDDFREVAERKQVVRKAEEARLDGALVKERQDLFLMSQVEGREEAPLNALRLPVMGKHPRPQTNAIPRCLSRQRHHFEAFRSLAGNGAGSRAEYH